MAALVATAAVAVGSFTVATLVGGGRGGNPRLVGGLPATLAGERLVLSGPGFIGEYTAGGIALSRLSVPGGGVPNFVLRGETVAFASGGSVFTAGLGRPGLLEHQPGIAVFSGPGGAIGVVGSPEGAYRRVGYVDAGGRPVDPPKAPLRLPAGVSPVAGMPAGLLGAALMVAPTPFVDLKPVVRLRLYSTGASIDIGTVSAVVAASSRTVAVVVCAGDGSDCHMALVDPVRRRSRQVDFPAGYREFAPLEGAFSPDGRTLAAFLVTPGPDGRSGLRAVLIDVATGRSEIVGPALPVAATSTQASWSGDGRWLFFQVGDGPVFAQDVRNGQPHGALWPLRLKAAGQLAAL